MRSLLARLPSSWAPRARHISPQLPSSFSRASSSSSAASATAAAFPPLTSFSEEEAAIKAAAAAFAAEHLPLARVLRMDAAGALEPSLVSALFTAGFMGMEVPQEHGGAGGTFMAACLAIEELAKADASTAVLVDVQNTLVNNVFKMYASPELAAFAWPRLAARSVASFCLSEPGSGSDAFALKTRAELRPGDDHYTLSGGKVWITNGGEADLFLIFATVDPAAGYKGITCFLAERGDAGLTIGKREDKLGIRASSTVQLHFDGLRVPKSRVVGKVGEGYKYAIG
jgi:short/branched chain acyl-CoA dehydrogenase